MAETMKAQIVREPYKMEYVDVPVPEINDDEVLIKIKVCGICGSARTMLSLYLSEGVIVAECSVLCKKFKTAFKQYSLPRVCTVAVCGFNGKL